MAGKLQAVSNATLGFLGLNTQDNGVTLESGYATQATNCIIDKSGRLGSRRGWEMVTTTRGELAATDYIESIYEVVKVDGSNVIISAGGGKLFTGTTTLTRLNVYGTDASGPAILSPQPTFTGGNRWQWATLQEGDGPAAETYAVATQRGDVAMVYREGGHTSGNYVLQHIGTGGYGTAPASVSKFDPDCCHAAFGRMWVAGLSENRLTLFYSQLLNPATFTGTGSGFLDISSKVGGNDEIVAITSHNGYLIVFCKRNTVIIGNADTPNDPKNTIQIVDVIPGIGCIARDSVQQAGNDVIFLSASGLRSLSRTVQEKSMPMRELSLSIRDDLVTYIEGESPNTIKSVYFERDAFYLLVLPSLNQVYYFDLRKVLENGAARVTVWNNIIPRAMFVSSNRTLYLGMLGGIAKYFGYTDNGSTYRMEYYTANTDFGQPFTLKILKKAKVIVIASGSQDIIIKYGFDYRTDFSSRVYTKDFIGSGVEYSYGVNFTGSCSGTTLTVTGGTAPSIGMVVYTATGTNLGTVTAGSGTTFTVSTGGTISSQAMVAATPGGSEYSNLPGQPGYTGAEFTGGIAIAEIDLNLGGSGKILQFGIEATVEGAPLSLQQMNVYTKVGKTT